MKITEVRIFPTESKDGKLKAFATMTFDDWFVVRNVKIIQGNNGLFVAMPSRKAMDSCPKCSFKNAVGSKYCNQCGAELPPRQHQAEDASDEKQGDHMDVAHPISQECRVYIQEQVLGAYNKSAQSGQGPRGQSERRPFSRDTAVKQAPQASDERGNTRGPIAPKGPVADRKMDTAEDMEDTKDIEL